MGAAGQLASEGLGPGGHPRPEGLRDAVTRLEAAEAIAHLGSWNWDIPTNVVNWSGELYRIYGLEPWSIPITYETFLRLLPEEERERVAGIIGACLETGEPAVFTHRYVMPDGEVHWQQGRAHPVMEGGRPVRMFGTCQDITERVRSEEALRQSLADARRLARENEALRGDVEAQLREVRASRARLVEAADAERRRLERDLHDGAQQRLTTLGLMLRAAQSQVGADLDPGLASVLSSAVEELQAGLADLRSLARGIHPVILTEEGLVPAVRSLAGRSPLPVRLLVQPMDRPSEPVEVAAYFIVSEALANALKHASASSISVSIERQDGVVVVEVADDGSGGAVVGTGSGLGGLANRVAALDGLFEVHSPAGGGTRLRAELPCR
jgi:PAS domain S-box-containing protein